MVGNLCVADEAYPAVPPDALVRSELFTRALRLDSVGFHQYPFITIRSSISYVEICSPFMFTAIASTCSTASLWLLPAPNGTGLGR